MAAPFKQCLMGVTQELFIHEHYMDRLHLLTISAYRLFYTNQIFLEKMFCFTKYD